MSKFVTDIFVRRLTQASLITAILIISLFQILFLYLSFDMINSSDSSLLRLQNLVIDVLRFPFEKEFSSFSIIIAGMIPIIVSSVCFSLDANHQITDQLNITGHAVLTIMAVGALAGFFGIAVAGLYEDILYQMIPDKGVAMDKTAKEAARVAVRNSLSAILAFELFYATQLLGVKK